MNLSPRDSSPRARCCETGIHLANPIGAPWRKRSLSWFASSLARRWRTPVENDKGIASRLEQYRNAVHK